MLVDPVVSQEDMEEPSQPADKASLPSTSQEPTSSSAGVKHFYIFRCVTLYQFAEKGNKTVVFFRYKQCSP